MEAIEAKQPVVKFKNIAVPEWLVSQLKKEFKEEGKTFVRLGDYLVYLLDERKIISCENARLAEEMRICNIEVAGLKAQITLLEEQNKSSVIKEQEFLKERHSIAEQIAATEAKNEQLVRELNNMKDKYKQLNDKYSTLHSSKTSLERRYNEAVMSLSDKNNLYEATEIELRKAKQTTAIAGGKIESMQEVINGLRQELKEKETFVGKIKNLFC